MQFLFKLADQRLTKAHGLVDIRIVVPLNLVQDCFVTWLGEHCAFVVEEFIANGGLPIATQHAFRIRLTLSRRDPVPDKKKFMTGCETSDKRVLL